jgi:ABC-type polysaccharide/polyol phosphate export permease
MTASSPDARIVSARLGLSGQVRGVWEYRELLVGLVRTELKVKYRGSTLGFLWSLLNPALTLFVFYLAFDVFLDSGVPGFPIYLLCGLLAWNLFSAGLAGATGSVVANAGLVNKVFFPRLILPLASVGAALVHFFLQATVLVVVLVATTYDVAWTWMWLIVPALITLILLTSAIAVMLSAVNVYARDTQHFLELGLLAWFWMTPIVYWYDLVASKVEARGWPSWVPLLNPVTPIVITFQRVFYNRVVGEGETSSRGGLQDIEVFRILPNEPQLWYFTALAVVSLFSIALLAAAVHVFSRLEGNFAEEL